MTGVGTLGLGETESGMVRGAREMGVTVFRGIPYTAPVRRFALPEPPPRWKGMREMRAFGPPAPQPADPLAWVPGLQLAPGARENCLTLNIWTTSSRALRPVLVFLHGGAFVSGSGGQALYDGAALARSHDLVVVTVNYRLGILGFACDDEIPANLGLRDQLAALRWVRDNIAAFGGDPAQVTLAGHGTGGTSVLALLGSPAATGLFARAALMSAIPYGFATPAQARAVTTAARRALGRAWLRTAPLPSLVSAGLFADRRPFEGLLPVAPVVDGSLLPRHPMESIRTGEAMRIPLLITTTSEEMRLYSSVDPAGASRASVRTEMIFERPAAELTRAHRGSVHRVRFGRPSPLAHGGVRLGACHLADVPFYLGTLHNRRVAPLTGGGPSALALGAAATGAFAGFCHGLGFSLDVPELVVM